MQTPLRNLSRPKRVAKLSHEDIARHLAEYEARGGKVRSVPGFTEQDVKPRANWSWGNGAGPQ